LWRPHYLETHGRRGTSNTHSTTSEPARAKGRDESRKYHRFSRHAQDQGELTNLRVGIELMRQGAFFFLLQSEDGDLFKCWIEHEGEEVKSLKIKYFDTVPVAASLCILKSGYLFVASEFSDQ
jgi:hypothetical protein